MPVARAGKAIRRRSLLFCYARSQPNVVFSTLQGLAKRLVLLEYDNGNCLGCVFWIEEPDV
jgi:hypothetical protein